jgi:hypothetical protein
MKLRSGNEIARRQQPSLAPGNDATSDLCNRYLVGDLVQIIGGINCYGASGVITELTERRAQVELSAPGKDVVLISQCFLEKQAFIEPTIYNNKASAPNDVSRLNSTDLTLEVYRFSRLLNTHGEMREHAYQLVQFMVENDFCNVDVLPPAFSPLFRDKLLHGNYSGISQGFHDCIKTRDTSSPLMVAIDGTLIKQEP